MSANSGRKIVIKVGGTAIAGAKEKSFSANGEAVDITSDDDQGFRTFLPEAGNMMIDISLSGVAAGDALRTIATSPSLTGRLMTNVTLEFPDETATTTITGNFYLASYEESGSTTDQITFSASLQSSGAWTSASA